jgi:hypothetical protein
MAASYAAAASFTASYANDTATDAINIVNRGSEHSKEDMLQM